MEISPRATNENYPAWRKSHCGINYSELNDDADVIAIGPQAVNGAPQSATAGQTRNRPRRIGFDNGDSDAAPLLPVIMFRTSRGEFVLVSSLH